MRPQDMVAEFHRATGATIGDTPAIRDAKLRADLIAEELDELRYAIGARKCDHMSRGVHWEFEGATDLIAAIDALADLLYVVYGAAVTFGVDMQPFLEEVHRSNMTKVGGPVRPDGKRLKPDTYEPPNLLPILQQQHEFAGGCEGEGNGAYCYDPDCWGNRK